MLLMKRPRKTRLRWMMEMPGMSVPPHPHPSYGSPAEIPKHISALGTKQSKMEVMELSDLHHPNCKMNRKINSGADVGGLGDPCRRESESSDSILLSPEASKATEAVEFIAEHLRNEDLYIQVSYIFEDNCNRTQYQFFYHFRLAKIGNTLLWLSIVCSCTYSSSLQRPAQLES
jgi:hypothetical protein